MLTYPNTQIHSCQLQPSVQELLYSVPNFPTTPKRSPAQAVAAPSVAEEVTPQRENLLPKKEPPLQPSHSINKIRDPSSPGPGACGWGRRKEAGRGAHSTAVPARLGNIEVKRAPSSSPGQRSPPQLFPPLYSAACSDNCAKTTLCHRASSCHLCGS